MDEIRDEAVAPIHPFIFAANIKVSAGIFREGLSPYIVTDAEAKKSANMLIAALDDAKKAFTNSISSTAVSEEGFQTAFQDYIGALLVMINATNKGTSSTTSSSPPKDNDDVDNALTAAADVAPIGPGTGGTKSLGSLTGDSSLRYAVKFSWNQVLINTKSPNVEIADAVYELASAIIAAAVWCQRRAALFHCESTPLGTPSGPSGQAYKLLREAAGLYEYASTKVLPLLSRTLSSTTEASDCTAPVLQAANLCALGDAQSITVLRAISKGNSSLLIASLARDTADLYKDGAGALLSSTIKDAKDSKLVAYLQYKQAVFESYAQIFNGIAQWKAGQAGTGVASLKEAETIYFTVKKLAAAFDKAPPSSLGKLHVRFDDELDKVLYDTLRSIEKENAAVYYQRVPDAASPLPEGKRLAASTAFELPLKVPKSVENTDADAVFKGVPTSAAENSGKKNGSGSSSGGCLRCLFCCCAANAVVDEEVKKNDGKTKKEEENGKKTEAGGGGGGGAAAEAKK